MIESIADIIRAQGIEPLELDQDELVADTIVLLRTIDPDGDERIYLASTDGMSRHTRIGMLVDALDGQRTQGWAIDDD